MALLGAIIAFIGLAVVGDLVSEEVRERLKAVPRSVLWLGARLVPAQARESRLTEWRGELEVILSETDGLPITRLCKGIWFAVSLLLSVDEIRAELGLARRRLLKGGRDVLATLLVIVGSLMWFGAMQAAADDSYPVPLTFSLGWVTLFFGLSCALLEFLGARVVVWTGVGLMFWSGYALSGIESNWTSDLLLVCAAITVCGALGGCIWRQWRRPAAAAMAALPTGLTLFAVYIVVQVVWHQASNPPVGGVGSVLLLLLISAVMAVRYLRIAAGLAEWREGTRKFVTRVEV